MIQKGQMKDTVLDDSAEIYQQRKELTEKQKLSTMPLKEKLIYFNNYYRNKTIAIIAIMGFIIYIVYTVFSHKTDIILYTAAINDTIDSETATTLQNNFSDYLEIDSKTKEVFLDTSMTIGNVDAVGGHALENEQKLVTLLAASQIDIMIAPKSLFTKYAAGGYLMKLSDQLTTDICTYLADSFYYSQPKGTLTNGAYGIYISNSSIYQNSNHSIEDPPVLGIVVNSKHKDAAAEFIKFIYQDK